MKLRAGIIFTPDKTDSHLEAKPYLRLQRKQRAQPSQEQQEGQGRISFFRTKVRAAKIVERWEPDYGEVDPEERDRKGGHLWWWQAPSDTDDEVGA